MTVAQTEWRVPLSHPPLAANQVHIWRASLDVADDALEEYQQLLAEDEAARAECFVFARDRRRYIAARGTLRTLLGHYLGVAAGAIAFTYGRQGKPFLARPHHAGAPAFNLSHAENVAVYAFAPGGQLGIDIEFQRAIKDLRQLAACVFSTRELATLDALPPAQQPAAFYACWTRKEAFVKAIGKGFSFPLARFDVSLAPGEPCKLVRVHDDPDEAQRWRMDAFSPGENFSGAVVTEHPTNSIAYWQAGHPYRQTHTP